MFDNKIYFDWSPTVIAITVCVFVTLAAIIAVCLYRIFSEKPVRFFSWNGAAVVVCIGVACSLVVGMPISFSYGEGGVRINKVLSTTVIPSADIESVRVISYGDLGDVTRVDGSGGTGGYFGLFHSSVIGDYNSYISDLSDPLLSISTPQGIYIINAKDAPAIAHTLR